MMRLGLISDIHADLQGLERALARLIAEGADKIICLGDLVEKGHDGNEVIALLQDWCIPCVRGNHDDLALVNQHTLEDTDSYATKLNAESLAYLKTLPFSREYLWENQRILLVHGSPRDNRDYFRANLGKREYTHFLGGVDVDVILCGHTHDPVHFVTQGVHVVNPGSVCGAMSRDSQTCAILSLPRFEFELFSLEER